MCKLSLESEVNVKLLGLLLGFTFAIIGVIIAIHSIHYVVGLLITFGGMYTTLSCLPHYKEKI